MNHKFVDTIPETIEEGILYVSIPFETVIHKCCCGCGNEIVTPISPTDWILTFDGESITLHPSIGSWSLDCRSHYFIRKNNVVWSDAYSIEEIKSVREVDLEDKLKYYDKVNAADQYSPKELESQHSSKGKFRLIEWFKQLLKIK